MAPGDIGRSLQLPGGDKRAKAQPLGFRPVDAIQFWDALDVDQVRHAAQPFADSDEQVGPPASKKAPSPKVVINPDAFSSVVGS